MEKDLTIYFTSDTHGYFSNIDYTTGKRIDTGLINCMSQFKQDGNSLIIDGGDTLQGSPFTYYLHKNALEDICIPAQIMNFGGYQFVTLGNHDFNYGTENLAKYVSELNAKCLCANVEGIPGIEKTAVTTLANGLKIGITGIVTHYINIWERPENLKGVIITEPVPAAKAALEYLKTQNTDINICIYHGGFENDLDTGMLLADTDENQGYKICRELDYDILFTGHQHIPVEGRRVFDTYVCQTPDKAKKFICMKVTADCKDKISGKNSVASGLIKVEAVLNPASSVSHPEGKSVLDPYDELTAKWLDTPVGHLDCPLVPDTAIHMAEYGSYLANFFNQVQLEASGADISATCLANEVKGLDKDVTIRDVVATYIFPNTLQTIRVNRNILKQALERSAEYFAVNKDGTLRVSDVFLKPKVEHYNFDYFSGINVTVDATRNVGDRVVSIVFNGEELSEDKELTICMNDYRAKGTGGYGCYKDCAKVKELPHEIAELIMEFVIEHEDIIVDKTRWLNVIH